MLVKVIFSKTLKNYLKPLGLIHRIIVSSLPNQPKNICFQTLQLFLECILSSRLRFRLYYSASLHVIFWKSIFMSFKRIFQFLAQFCCWISVSSVSGFGGTFFFLFQVGVQETCKGCASRVCSTPEGGFIFPPQDGQTEGC